MYPLFRLNFLIIINAFFFILFNSSVCSLPFFLNVVQDAWYGNVVYLGKEQDIPVITMT